MSAAGRAGEQHSEGHCGETSHCFLHTIPPMNMDFRRMVAIFCASRKADPLPAILGPDEVDPIDRKGQAAAGGLCSTANYRPKVRDGSIASISAGAAYVRFPPVS